MPSDTPDDASRFLSVEEVASELGVSTKHVRRLIARGEIVSHRFGRAVRIARDDFDRFVGCCRV